MKARRIEMTITEEHPTTIHASVDGDGDVTFENVNGKYWSVEMMRAFASMLIDLAQDVETEMVPVVEGTGLWEYEV